MFMIKQKTGLFELGNITSYNMCESICLIRVIGLDSHNWNKYLYVLQVGVLVLAVCICDF